MRINRSVLLLFILSLLSFVLPAVAETSKEDVFAQRRGTLDKRPKKIFAHYMGCFPVGSKAIAPSYTKSKMKNIRHDSSNADLAFGGMWRGYLLLPDAVNELTLEASADLDIRRAMRAGIDGFAIDVLAGGESNVFPVLDALFKVAEEKNYPFEITWCLDNPKQNELAIDYLLKKHGQSPKLARRDGKVLFLGYNSYRQGLAGAIPRWEEKHPEFKGKDTESSIEFRSTPEGWLLLNSGFRDLEKHFNTPMYFQFGIGGFNPCLPNDKNARSIVDAVSVLSENFDAITSFHGYGAEYDAMAAAVRSKGAEWGQPIMYQYQNLIWSDWKWFSPDGDSMRAEWDGAIKNKSTLIQFTTWNDYNEHTNLAPTTTTNYTLLDLTAYYVTLWKTGSAPKPDHDKIYVLYPKYSHELETYPFGSRSRWRNVPSVLEVITILPSPATVRIPGREEAWEAPAGLFWKQIPLKVGPVSLELIRNGKVDVSFKSPESVTDRPFREQHDMFCYSTEELRHWKEDFGDASSAPLLRGEYSDDDNDGLPNWFEMYWFGNLGDWSTTTAAAPKADPDGDGITNLQEYLNRSNPTVPTVYKPGYVWDFMKIGSRKAAFNPELDACGTPVWYYLHKYSADLPLIHDGNYWPCERFSWKPDKDVTRAYFASPYNTPGGDFLRTWTVKGEGKDSVVSNQFVMTAGRNSLQVLAWCSPVSGRVTVDLELDPSVAGNIKNEKATLSIEHSKPYRELLKKIFVAGEGLSVRVSDIDVKQGDKLYIVADTSPGNAKQVPVAFKKLSVTLQP